MNNWSRRKELYVGFFACSYILDKANNKTWLWDKSEADRFCSFGKVADRDRCYRKAPEAMPLFLKTVY